MQEEASTVPQSPYADNPAQTFGRPTDYNPAIAAEVCEALISGKALYELCESQPHWPHIATIYRWKDANPDFREQFTRARELKAHRYVEEQIALSDSASAENVRVRELQIKTRQWVSGKLNRQDYGDHPAATATAVTVNVVSIAAGVTEKLKSLADRAEPKLIEG